MATSKTTSTATRQVKSQRPKKLHYISWRSNHGYGAWQVNISRQGFKTARHFGVTRHGGKQAALRAAQAWRDAVLEQLPPMTTRLLHTVVRSNSHSGIPGVRRQVRSDTDNKSVRWVASLATQGQTREKGFSVMRFGEDGARQLAIEARRQFLLETGSHSFSVGAGAKALTSRIYGDVAQVAPDNVPLAWDKQSAQLRQLERIKKGELLPDPPVRAERARLLRRSYPSTGPLWEVCVKLAPGKRKVVRFYVSEHGEEKARCLAEAVLGEYL